MMFKCPNDSEHDIFIVFPGCEDEDPDGIGVQVEASGEVTNYWGDGTFGVDETLKELADDEITAICAYCHPAIEIAWS